MGYLQRVYWNKKCKKQAVIKELVIQLVESINKKKEAKSSPVIASIQTIEQKKYYQLKIECKKNSIRICQICTKSICGTCTSRTDCFCKNVFKTLI